MGSLPKESMPRKVWIFRNKVKAMYLNREENTLGVPGEAVYFKMILEALDQDYKKYAIIEDQIINGPDVTVLPPLYVREALVKAWAASASALRSHNYSFGPPPEMTQLIINGRLDDVRIETDLFALPTVTLSNGALSSRDDPDVAGNRLFVPLGNCGWVVGINYVSLRQNPEIMLYYTESPPSKTFIAFDRERVYDYIDAVVNKEKTYSNIHQEVITQPEPDDLEPIYRRRGISVGDLPTEIFGGDTLYLPDTKHLLVGAPRGLFVANLSGVFDGTSLGSFPIRWTHVYDTEGAVKIDRASTSDRIEFVTLRLDWTNWEVVSGHVASLVPVAFPEVDFIKGCASKRVLDPDRLEAALEHGKVHEEEKERAPAPE